MTRLSPTTICKLSSKVGYTPFSRASPYLTLTLTRTPYPGTVQPRKIPVNVSLQSQPHSDALFGGADMDAFSLGGTTSQRRPVIVMTTPERPQISGLVEIRVSFDPGRPRGVAVGVNGAMGVDLRLDAMEEVCRRGGLFGLPGRVWKKAHEIH